VPLGAAGAPALAAPRRQPELRLLPLAGLVGGAAPPPGHRGRPPWVWPPHGGRGARRAIQIRFTIAEEGEEGKEEGKEEGGGGGGGGRGGAGGGGGVRRRRRGRGSARADLALLGQVARPGVGLPPAGPST
jgi:hypothetical protein